MLGCDAGNGGRDRRGQPVKLSNLPKRRRFASEPTGRTDSTPIDDKLYLDDAERRVYGRQLRTIAKAARRSGNLAAAEALEVLAKRGDPTIAKISSYRLREDYAEPIVSVVSRGPESVVVVSIATRALRPDEEPV